MYKPDLVLNNLHWLICHKTKPMKCRGLQNEVLVWLGSDFWGLCIG